MFKNIVVLILLGIVKSAVPEDITPYDSTNLKIDPEASSVELKESKTFGSCPCDVTVGACDNYCCCDKDCA